MIYYNYKVSFINLSDNTKISMAEELTEREKQLELTRELKETEMGKVMDFLINTVGIKTHKGILL